MQKVAIAMAVMALNLSPLVALAQNGNAYGINGKPGGGPGNSPGAQKAAAAPLSIVGASIPGLAVAGAIYFIARRKRTNKPQE